MKGMVKSRASQIFLDQDVNDIGENSFKCIFLKENTYEGI